VKNHADQLDLTVGRALLACYTRPGVGRYNAIKLKKCVITVKSYNRGHG